MKLIIYYISIILLINIIYDIHKEINNRIFFIKFNLRQSLSYLFDCLHPQHPTNLLTIVDFLPHPNPITIIDFPPHLHPRNLFSIVDCLPSLYPMNVSSLGFISQVSLAFLLVFIVPLSLLFF